MPLQMFVFPVNPAGQAGPKTSSKYLQIPNETAQVSPQDIAANREAWIKAWTETVLR